MAVEVALNTPLADALGNAVQTKLMETGWASGGIDDSALGEYIILMLVNGKTQEQIAAELSADLLSLPPEDTKPTEFAGWLFDQAELLNQQLNGLTPGQAHPQPAEEQGASIRGAATRQAGEGGSADAMMSEAMEDVQDGAIPTGPKSMRSGSKPGVGNKRMIGQLSKAMDRSNETPLHRVRSQQGTERINMHGWQTPKGPRVDPPRGPRMQPNGRQMGGQNGNMANGGMMQMTPQQQMQLMAMFEQQAQMMAQIMPPQMQGMVQPAINPAFQNGGGQPQGRSLFDRVEGNPHRPNAYNPRNGNTFNPSRKPQTPNGNHQIGNDEISSSMEVESSQPNENPQETVCKFNLKCTKKDCPFAHQSPAAPIGTTIDVHDSCPFGAACKNKKCVGRHPSPFQRVAHASEQDCKFFPNCTNVSCPFRHPTMPMCKNGADCNREGCKFTHVNIMCKFNPCLNPECPYKHAEGQKRGKYGDKVWTAEQEKEHVSERKFIDDNMGEEELVVGEPAETAEASADNQGQGGSQHSAEVVA